MEPRSHPERIYRGPEWQLNDENTRVTQLPSVTLERPYPQPTRSGGGMPPTLRSTSMLGWLGPCRASRPSRVQLFVGTRLPRRPARLG